MHCPVYTGAHSAATVRGPCRETGIPSPAMLTPGLTAGLAWPAKEETRPHRAWCFGCFGVEFMQSAVYTGSRDDRVFILLKYLKYFSSEPKITIFLWLSDPMGVPPNAPLFRIDWIRRLRSCRAREMAVSQISHTHSAQRLHFATSTSPSFGWTSNQTITKQPKSQGETPLPKTLEFGTHSKVVTLQLSDVRKGFNDCRFPI